MAICRRLRYGFTINKLVAMLVMLSLFTWLSYTNYSNYSTYVSPLSIATHFSSKDPLHVVTDPQAPLHTLTKAYEVLALPLLEYINESYHGQNRAKYNFAGPDFLDRKIEHGFTLITLFHLFTGRKGQGYELETKADLTRRNTEYMRVIRENVNHPEIGRIVLFYTEPDVLSVLSRQNWSNITKVYPYKLDRLVHMADFFRVASDHLINQTVIAANGDIVIGENFEKIDTEKLRKNKVLFTLTRHGSRGLDGCASKSMCTEQPYVGSHDTHVFNLKEKVSNSSLSILDYPVNLQQAENGMIAVMSREEHFIVLNPCSTLTTYHVHCSRIANRLKPNANSIKQPPYNVKAILTSKPITGLRYA